MDGTHRVGFFLLVLFFAGSVVIVAVHELRERSMMQGQGSPESARRLIKQLRGEVLVNRKDEYVESESLPQRKPGSYLHDKDREKLNSLLQQVVPPSSP